MFMRFRGGGIGHVATRDWDEYLQREGRTFIPQDDVDSMPSDSENDGEEDEDELLDPEGATGRSDEEGEPEDDGADVDEDPDRVVADEGEELDDDVWEQEGYGAL
jgi:hypothetical protein